MLFAADSGGQGMKRAIVVESDENIRTLQKRILSKYAEVDEITEKDSLANALDIYSREHFHFALIDISRPSDVLGEFLHLSRRQRAPVIAFTTKEVSRDTLQLLLDDHVFAMFPKPFELDELVESVLAAQAAAKAGALYPRFYGFLDRLRHSSQ